MNNFIFFIVYIIELLWLMLDTINGLFINYLNFPYIAQIVRIFIFVLFLYIIIKFSKKRFLIVSFFVTLSILTSLHIVFYDNINSIKMLAKILLPILFLYVIKIQIDRNNLTTERIKNIVLFNSLVLLLNQYLFFLNIGFDNYGIDENTGLLKGGTGFFYAGNEVGVTLLGGFILLLAINYTKKFYLSLLFFTLFIIAALALMSKTAIFGVIIIYSIYLFTKYKLYILIPYLLLGIIPLISYLYSTIINYLEIIINRWEYFYTTYGYIYLLGGIKRWTFINDFLSNLNNNPINIFIGSGWSGESENNFFDLFEAYGLIGIFIYFVWIYVFIKFMKYKNKKEIKFVAFSFLLVILISFFAGHVVQSAMFSLFFGLMANYYLIGRKNYV